MVDSEDMLVSQRKSRVEESNLIKYAIIMSHREALEPPDTSRGTKWYSGASGPNRVSYLFLDFEGEADRRSYHPEGLQLTYIKPIILLVPLKLLP